MARPKLYYKWELPKTVVETVRSICADYDRRELAIKYSTISGEVLERYIELNSAIESALSEIAPEIREYMLCDVATGRGYDFSPCTSFVSRRIYYLKKRKLVHDIAEKLYLIPK